MCMILLKQFLIHLERMLNLSNAGCIFSFIRSEHLSGFILGTLALCIVFYGILNNLWIEYMWITHLWIIYIYLYLQFERYLPYFIESVELKVQNQWYWLLDYIIFAVYTCCLKKIGQWLVSVSSRFRKCGQTLVALYVSKHRCKLSLCIHVFVKCE